MKKMLEFIMRPMVAVAVLLFFLGIALAVLLVNNTLKDYEKVFSEYKDVLESSVSSDDKNESTLKNQISDLQNKLDLAKKNKSELEEYISKLESEIRELENNYEDEDLIYKELREEIKLLNKSIEDKNSEIDSLKAELEFLQKNNGVDINSQYLIISNLEKMLKEQAPMKKKVYEAQTSSGTVVTESGYLYPNISLYYEDLTYGFRYVWNGDETYSSSSCIYAPFIYSVLTGVAENGEKIFDGSKIFTYTEEKKLSSDGIIKNSEFGTQYTHDELVRLVLRYGDGIAYAELMQEYGQEYLNKITTKDIKNATVSDFGTIFKLLYSFTELGDDYSGVLKQEMQSAIDYRFIPYGVSPKKTAHQGCCQKDASHSMAIVYDEHPYILIIMTNYSDESEEVSRYMQNLSSIIDDLHESFYK